MTIGSSLILGALLVGWAAPSALRGLAAGSRDALAAIICWVVTILGVVGTFAAGAGLLLLPGDRPGGNIADLAEGCWALVRHGRAPELDELMGAAGIAILGIVLARFAWAAATSLRSRRRDRRTHWDLLRITQPSGAGEAGVLWLDHRAPFAYSVGGRPGLVVATTGLRALPETQRDAVLCHEAAHLRGRHHLLVALTHDLATVLPVVPLFRHAPAAMRQLVEFAADAAAARACGRPAVRAALLALHGGPEPRQALAMASRDVPLRLRRLAEPAGDSGRSRRVAVRAAVLTSAVTPALVGFGTLLLMLAIACPA